MSKIASKATPDGTVWLYTTAAGPDAIEFMIGKGSFRRTVTLRDGRHVYVLERNASP